MSGGLTSRRIMFTCPEYALCTGMSIISSDLLMNLVFSIWQRKKLTGETACEMEVCAADACRSGSRSCVVDDCGMSG